MGGGMTRDEFEKWLETDEGVSRFGMELTDAYRHFAWEGWQAGAVAERERCAQLCESYGMPDGTSETALALAAAIRRMK